MKHHNRKTTKMAKNIFINLFNMNKNKNTINYNLFRFITMFYDAPIT